MKELDEIEAAAGAIGATMSEVCERAGVPRSTPHNWKNGKFMPTLRTLGKLRGAVRQIARERAKATRKLAKNAARVAGAA